MRAAVLLFVIAACSPSSSTAGPSIPVQACLDVMSALASAYDRCGTSYDEAYAQQLSAIAAGSCNNIVGVRDIEALDETCIPSLRTVGCADLQAGNLDPSCQLQLQRTK